MCYTISIRVYQTNPNRGYFSIIEKTIWHYANGGTWSQGESPLTLTLGGSATSGVLRFSSDKGELITVALGVHDYKRWCDIVTGLYPEQTGLVIHGEYYKAGARNAALGRHLSEYSVTSAAGTKVQVVYTVPEGNNLQANIIFG